MTPLTHQFFWKYIIHYRWRFAFATLLSFVNKVFDITPEILIGSAISIVTKHEASFLTRIGITEHTTQLVTLAIITAFCVTGESLFDYLNGVAWGKISQDIQHDVRTDVYEHIQDISLTTRSKIDNGTIITTINEDVNTIEKFVSARGHGSLNAIIHLIAGTVIIGSIFFVTSPMVFLIAFAPIPLVALLIMYYQKKLARLYAVVRAHASRLTSAVNNNITNLPTIKSYVTEEQESASICAISDSYRGDNTHTLEVNAQLIPLVRLVVLIGFIGTMLGGGLLTLSGNMSISSYSILIFLTQRLTWPYTKLGAIVGTYTRTKVSINRIMRIRNLPHEVGSLNNELGVEDCFTHDISFKDVSFRYENKVRLFTDLTLTIPSQKTVAFVGTTGAGKSSIINLLLKFYAAEKGQILFGNTAIQDLQNQQLRRNISFVSQDIFLTEGTLAENISYGTPQASMNQIVQAAKRAHADEFIKQLPKQYDTIVDPITPGLSGGQKQRIAIARALLKNAPILVFDEATSAVDNETERDIISSLHNLHGEKTIIIIAHRLSTVRHADIIYVLDNGSILESGSHEELISQNGTYAQLWNIQTGNIERTPQLNTGSI